MRIVLATAVLSCFLLAGLLIDPAHAATSTPTPTPAKAGTATPTPTPTPPPKPPDPVKASDVLKAAEKYVGVPYVYGGFSPSGFDCSGYVSTIWQVTRHTTDTMYQVTKPISKDELLPGDALNYPLAGQIGHIRIFDKWATTDKALVWVYEATEPQVVHHVVPYDPRYMPVRRINITSDVPMPPPPPLPPDWNKPVAPKQVAASAAVPTKPPAVITGKVVDEKSGQPIANARVFYWTASEQYSVASVVTDKDGNWATPKTAAGTYELAAYASGYDVEFRGSLDLRNGGSAAFFLQLSRALGDQAGARIGSADAGTNAARDVSPVPPAALP